jgi:hypothetical protein
MKIELRKSESQGLKIGFLGDFAPGYPTYKTIRKSLRLRKLLHACDFVIANLESPLTSASSSKKWGSSLLSEPGSVNVLKELNINISRRR